MYFIERSCDLLLTNDITHSKHDNFMPHLTQLAINNIMKLKLRSKFKAGDNIPSNCLAARLSGWGKRGGTVKLFQPQIYSKQLHRL